MWHGIKSFICFILKCTKRIQLNVITFSIFSGGRLLWNDKLLLSCGRCRTIHWHHRWLCSRHLLWSHLHSLLLLCANIVDLFEKRKEKLKLLKITESEFVFLMWKLINFFSVINWFEICNVVSFCVLNWYKIISQRLN